MQSRNIHKVIKMYKLQILIDNHRLVEGGIYINTNNIPLKDLVSLAESLSCFTDSFFMESLEEPTTDILLLAFVSDFLFDSFNDFASLDASYNKVTFKITYTFF